MYLVNSVQDPAYLRSSQSRQSTRPLRPWVPLWRGDSGAEDSQTHQPRVVVWPESVYPNKRFQCHLNKDYILTQKLCDVSTHSFPFYHNPTTELSRGDSLSSLGSAHHRQPTTSPLIDRSEVWMARMCGLIKKLKKKVYKQAIKFE